MSKKSNNLKNTGNWIAVGVAVGAALAWKKPKN